MGWHVGKAKGELSSSHPIGDQTGHAFPSPRKPAVPVFTENIVVGNDELESYPSTYGTRCPKAPAFIHSRRRCAEAPPSLPPRDVGSGGRASQ